MRLGDKFGPVDLSVIGSEAISACDRHQDQEVLHAADEGWPVDRLLSVDWLGMSMQWSLRWCSNSTVDLSLTARSPT